MLASLDRAVPDWIASAPADGRERRRQLVALMLLEQARGQMIGELVEWACAFLRKGAPTEFERDWMVASLMLFQIGHREHRRRTRPSTPNTR